MSQNSAQAAPLRRNGFTFKHFFVAHDRCEMKVGTDGVLLGAWAPLEPAVVRILDIGSGSGLLALMLAQRSAGSATIDAVEMDMAAAEQAGENFAASPWANVLHSHCRTIQAFSAQRSHEYDLIVSNPPYFTRGVACRNPERANARYTTELDHATLLSCASRLLTAQGQLAVVLPADVGEAFVALALNQGWKRGRTTWVAEYRDRAPHRALMTFSLTGRDQPTEDRLDIRREEGSYSEDYRALAKDFYLAF